MGGLLRKTSQRRNTVAVNNRINTVALSRRPVLQSKKNLKNQNYNNDKTKGLERQHAPDYMIIILIAILVAVGAVIGYTNSPGLTEARGLPSDFYTTKQLIATAIGIVAFIITSRIRSDIWQKLVMPTVVIAAIAAIAVRLFGTPIYGAYRWLDIAGVSIQAAEVIKFALVLWLAHFIYQKRQEGDVFSVKNMKIIAGASLAILMTVAGLQSDLGSAVVMVSMIFCALFIAGLPKKYILYSIVVIVIAGMVAILPSSYRIQRVETFLNPTEDCLDAGYQVCQALISVGSGGVIGKGLGRSVQSYGYLPEALSDSIFAVIAENIGFLGSAFVILVFLELFRRLHKIAVASPNDYHRYLVYIIVIWLATQTIINIGAMVGLLPLKGITLPLISYGGTSIIFVMAALGIVFQISRFTNLRAAQVNESIREKSPQQNITVERTPNVYRRLR